MKTARVIADWLGTLLVVVGMGPALLSGTPAQSGAAGDEAGWQLLFDGKTLNNWKITEFYAPGPVEVRDGQIILSRGKELTGVTWDGPELPTTNYEVALQAMRIEGSDFFAGVTFPVDDTFCTLILGGWGGSTVGLSSLNGFDAAENRTTQSIAFENNRWYNVRIRVTPERIEVWLDERQIINLETKGYDIYTRIEVDPSQPLGVASWLTTAAIRDLRLRTLPGPG